MSSDENSATGAPAQRTGIDVDAPNVSGSAGADLGERLGHDQEGLRRQPIGAAGIGDLLHISTRELGDGGRAAESVDNAAGGPQSLESRISSHRRNLYTIGLVAKSNRSVNGETDGDQPTLPAMRAAPNPESMEAIGHRLKRTREAMKLKQATFSRLVGIEPQAWNNYERGAKRIGVDNALKVCKATGVSLDWIYRGIAAQLPVNLATALQSLDR